MRSEDLERSVADRLGDLFDSAVGANRVVDEACVRLSLFVLRLPSLSDRTSN